MPSDSLHMMASTVTTRLLLLFLAGVISCHSEPAVGGRTAHELIVWLGNPDPDVRAGAARALGGVFKIAPQSSHVVDALVAALGDSVDQVRIAAGVALSQPGVRPESAVPALIAALGDSAHAFGRTQAATLFGSFGRCSPLVRSAPPRGRQRRSSRCWSAIRILRCEGWRASHCADSPLPTRIPDNAPVDADARMARA